MSPELTLYYDGVKVDEIAKTSKVSEPSMRARLRRERMRLKLDPRSRLHVINESIAEFIADKLMIIILIKSGITAVEISEKWELNKETVKKYLRKWGVLIDKDARTIDSYSLSELYTGWSDITNEAIITINRKPTFKLVRII